MGEKGGAGTSKAGRGLRGRTCSLFFRSLPLRDERFKRRSAKSLARSSPRPLRMAMADSQQLPPKTLPAREPATPPKVPRFRETRRRFAKLLREAPRSTPAPRVSQAAMPPATTRPSRRSGEPRQSARAKAARNERRRRQQQAPRQKRQSSHAAKCRGAWAETSTYVLSKTEIRRRRQRRRIDETHTPSLLDSAFFTEKSVRNAISQRAKTSRALAQPSDGTSGALRRSEK